MTVTSQGRRVRADVAGHRLHRGLGHAGVVSGWSGIAAAVLPAVAVAVAATLAAGGWTGR